MASEVPHRHGEFEPERPPADSPEQAALREAEEKFAATFDACPVAISLTSLRDGQHLEVNPAWLELFGYRREEVIGRTVTELGTWKHPEERARFLAELSAGGAVGGHEHEFVRRSGTTFPGLLSWHPFRLRGEPVVVAVVVDFTERKRAEEALAAERALLGAILEQAADGIIVRDCAGRVTFVNAVARRRAARPPEGTTLVEAAEVWGEAFDVAGNRLPVEEWPITKALQGQMPAVAELSRVTPAGERIVMLSNAAPVWNERGDVIGAVAISTDITARKDTERALRQAVADRDTLLREVHHRTKNDLAMVASLLQLQAEAIQNPEGQAALEESHARVHSFALLHEQLYRSLEGGQIRLGEYLGRIVAAFEEAHQVPIIRRLPREPLLIDVDRAIPCGLIVTELLTNAVKHAYADGPIGEIGVACAGTGATCELVVWDRGSGLPAELRIEEASSLGLRLVRILLRRLSGEVSIATEEGTAFRIRFPR